MRKQRSNTPQVEKHRETMRTYMREKRGYKDRHPIMPTLTPVEAAYLAGFFDGEGSIGIYPAGSSKALKMQVSVAGLHRRSIERFSESFGFGNVSEVKAKQREGRISAWGWSVVGESAKIVLAILLPYLSVKREQAEIAMTFVVGNRGRVISIEERAHREAIAARLKSLKITTLDTEGV